MVYKLLVAWSFLSPQGRRRMFRDYMRSNALDTYEDRLLSHGITTFTAIHKFVLQLTALNRVCVIHMPDSCVQFVYQ